jgi:hypothetical protein
VNAIANLARRLPGRRPAPSFTPAPRHLAQTRPHPAVAQTGPMHVPHGRHTAPAPVRTEPGSAAERAALLHRVRGGLQRLPDHQKAETLTHAAGKNVMRQFETELRRHFEGELLPVPGAVAAAPLSRAGRFTRDARRPSSGGLPVFRAVGKDLGWAGLDSLGDSPWPAAEAARKSMALIGAQTDTARAGVWQGISDAARREAQLRAAADADAEAAADANLILRRHEGVL